MKKYDIILADPPWSFKAYSSKGEDRSAKNHYSVMTHTEILRLPVQSIAADDSVLFLWAIDPMIEQAYEVMRAWGFIPKTVGFYWVKQNKNNDDFFVGLGYYTRANPEQCLLGTRGNGLKRLDKGVPKLIVSRRGEHSEKPYEATRRIERLFGDTTRRIELFARTKRPGWDMWGNEIESDIKLRS